MIVDWNGVSSSWCGWCGVTPSESESSSSSSGRWCDIAVPVVGVAVPFHSDGDDDFGSDDDDDGWSAPNVLLVLVPTVASCCNRSCRCRSFRRFFLLLFPILFEGICVGGWWLDETTSNTVGSATSGTWYSEYL